MCLIAFAYKVHPKYDLILITNRDESFNRPTRPLDYWTEEGYENVLAGKDLKAGGTWMGVNKTGSWTALTNFRDPEMQKKDAPSRGHLTLEYLKKSGNPKTYLEQIHHQSEQYEGFNILTGQKDQLFYYSNAKQNLVEVEKGIHGLSNALLNTPWPKLNKAQDRLESLVLHDTIKKDALFDILSDTETAPEDELPDTGIPKEWEKAVSSIFIQTESYGTRSSSILLIEKCGKIHFSERRFEPGTTNISEENEYKFNL